ncbi:glutaredoxin [Hesseltinella vesiculosa]|uniref:Glutaredoxin n=1 Tax=Hesseltinella vesiculosa TaxID=101127 RepID=A0A1X2GSG4_9FUNG|nr:glutaredoxin [Hesseltinella vesiculosa]
MTTLIKEFVKKTIVDNKVTIFSKSYCPYCLGAKDLFDDLRVEYKALELNERDDGPEIQQALLDMTKQRTVPNIFVNQVHVGGSDDLKKALDSGKLATLLKDAGIKSHLMVIPPIYRELNLDDLSPGQLFIIGKLVSG